MRSADGGFYTDTTWPFLTSIILLLLSILYFYFSSIIGLAWVQNLLIHNYRVIFPRASSEDGSAYLHLRISCIDNSLYNEQTGECEPEQN